MIASPEGRSGSFSGRARAAACGAFGIALALLFSVTESAARPGRTEGLSKTDRALLSLYQQNPAEFNAELRRAYASGQTHSRLIDEVERSFEDFSFSDLRLPSEDVRRAVLLQEKARTLWREGDLKGARQLLRLALRSLAADRQTERVFTLYLLAEVEADRENWKASIDLAFEAIDQSNRPRRLLEGLLLDSLGYSFWYLDRIEEASWAFEHALARWLGFTGPGITVHALNNLAILFWEMGFTLRAEQLYREGLRHLDRVDHPEVAFGLLRNLALLLHRNGRTAESRRLLKELRALGPVAPVELILTEAEILERPEMLDSLQPQRSELVVDLAHARGAFASRAGRHDLAEEIFREALDHTISSPSPFLRRSLLPELARSLEKQGRFREAAQLHLEGLQEQSSRLADSRRLPFPRLAGPFLDGYVRCLVELNSPWKARSAIRERAAARSRESRRFLQSIREEPDRFGALAPESFGSRQESRSVEKKPVILEFWPSLDETFVWIDSSNGSRFLRLPTPGLPLLLESSVREFSTVQEALPPQPSPERLARLYDMLILPLMPFLPNDPLQITAHRSLEQFPFEMLRSPDGNWLFEDRILSYWPKAASAPSDPIPGLGPPSAAFSPSILAKESGRNERSQLRRIFPNLREEFPWSSKGAAHFHHLAAHIRPGSPFWIHSSLEEEVPLPDLFRLPFHCNLLSLAACDLANSELLATPFWMGAAELFVQNGARSLLISRWKLDEASVPIYLDFLRRVRKGETLGAALQGARKDFLHRKGTSRSNPFYWAGLALVGNPNMRLYPDDARRFDRIFTSAFFLLAALLLWTAFRIRT